MRSKLPFIAKGTAPRRPFGLLLLAACVCVTLFSCATDQIRVDKKPPANATREDILAYYDTIAPPPPLVERSTTPSRFAKGLVPYESVSNKEKFTYTVFGFDRSDYKRTGLIRFFVAVRDSKGNFISNLAPKYNKNKDVTHHFFRSLVETVDSANKTIENFDVTEWHEQMTPPYSFSLVLDHSGSMIHAIGDLQSGAKRFVELMPDGDKSMLIGFDDRILIDAPLSEKNELIGLVPHDGLARFGRFTAWIAACDQAVTELSYAKGTKAAVLFTDGHDNCSSLHMDRLNFRIVDLIEHAREKGVRICTIGYGGADTMMLSKVATLADGYFEMANDGLEIDAILEDLARQFKSYYMISYKPTSKDGLHQVTLKCDDNVGSEAIARGSTFMGDGWKKLIPNAPYVVVQFDATGAKNVDQFFLPNIQRWVEYLNAHPKARIEVRGHTDLSGSPDKNMALSKERADVVMKMLTDAGVDKTRVTSIGVGIREPIWKPDPEEYMKLENRRVEILIKD